MHLAWGDLPAGRVQRAVRAGVCVAACLALSGCAARRLTLPVDPGQPLPAFADTYRAVTASCGGVRTLTAELGLSGRAGARRVGGRAIVGIERSGSIRLEGVAPFGPPAFILAARGMAATLLLPRDNRVVRDVGPAEILGALTGVTLSPADLLAVLTGCIVPLSTPTTGRVHGNGWASIDVAGGATIYLERAGRAWRVRAGRRPPWQVEYATWNGAFPGAVRLTAPAGSANVDLTATISQLETNLPIDDAAFAVNVPAGAVTLTVDELRNLGPLSDR